MIKSFHQFINESYKTIGLSEPKVFSDTITYDGDLRWFTQEYQRDAKSAIEDIVKNLKLTSGEIFFDGDEFLVSGTTENGNIIYIEQYGEFSKYGGIYDPKMEKPTVKVNGTDIYPIIWEIFDTMYDLDKDEIPDMTRVDVYGYVMNKDRNFFLGKKYGI